MASPFDKLRKYMAKPGYKTSPEDVEAQRQGDMLTASGGREGSYYKGWSGQIPPAGRLALSLLPVTGAGLFNTLSKVAAGPTTFDRRFAKPGQTDQEIMDEAGIGLPGVRAEGIGENLATSTIQSLASAANPLLGAGFKAFNIGRRLQSGTPTMDEAGQIDYGPVKSVWGGDSPQKGFSTVQTNPSSNPEGFKSMEGYHDLSGGEQAGPTLGSSYSSGPSSWSSTTTTPGTSFSTVSGPSTRMRDYGFQTSGPGKVWSGWGPDKAELLNDSEWNMQNPNAGEEITAQGGWASPEQPSYQTEGSYQPESSTSYQPPESFSYQPPTTSTSDQNTNTGVSWSDPGQLNWSDPRENANWAPPSEELIDFHEGGPVGHTHSEEVIGDGRESWPHFLRTRPPAFEGRDQPSPFTKDQALRFAHEGGEIKRSGLAPGGDEDRDGLANVPTMLEEGEHVIPAPGTFASPQREKLNQLARTIMRFAALEKGGSPFAFGSYGKLPDSPQQKAERKWGEDSEAAEETAKRNPHQLRPQGTEEPTPRISPYPAEREHKRKGKWPKEI